MKVVFSEFGNFKKQFLIFVFSSIGMALATMALPLLMGLLVDKAVPNEDMKLAVKLVLIMIAMIGVDIISGIIQSKYAAQITMGICMNIRAKVFAKVQIFSQEEIDRFSTASLITRTNADIYNIQVFLNQSLCFAVYAPFLCIVGVILSVTTSPALSKVLLFMIPVLVVIIVIICKKMMPLSNAIQEDIDRINLVIREKLTGIRVIRAFGTSAYEEKRFDDINASYCKKNKTLITLTNIIQPVTVTMIAIAVLIVILMAYAGYANGKADYTIGNVVAVIQYVLQIMQGAVMMTLVFMELPRALSSSKRVKEVLDSQSSIENPENPAKETGLKGYVEFKNVSFTYSGAEKPAIKNLSFKTSPGEVTAIIGGTGMGKTTIVNLIPRLYDAIEGEVLVDGINVKDYDLKTLRKKIGFVPQKAFLFKGTIRSNLIFEEDESAKERLKKAVRVAQSYDFIMSKENGFDSDVDQGGKNFSGGQKQRLCIARAIAKEPEIYIFDDSFSALDYGTDRMLREALKSETAKATTIIVAQRVNTIKNADRIIVVENGEVAGIGTHKELMENCKVYREIALSQMSKEEIER